MGCATARLFPSGGNSEGKSNKGKLCVKGRFGIAEFVTHPDRLTSPLVKGENGQVQASWDDALQIVADRFKTYSPEEIAVVASARTTNEDVYAVQKLARAVLGTNNVDNCARL